MKLNTSALLSWLGKIPSHFISGMAAGSISGAGVGALSFGGDIHSIERSALYGLIIAGAADVRSFIKANPMPDLFVESTVDPAPAGPASSAVTTIALVGLLTLGCFGLTGCTTISTSAPAANGSSNKVVDWVTVDYVVQTAAKYATAAVLNNNPRYAADVAAVNSGAAAIFVGTPTTTSISAAIKAVAPDLADADIATIASVVIDAYGLYVAKTGKAELLPTDTVVQGLVAALTSGITQGVALHAASAPAKPATP